MVKVHTGTTIAASPRIRWIAPTIDGRAHAYPVVGAADAACGALRIDERFGYSVKVHCDDCLIVMGAEAARTAPVSESEQRALWGDR